MQKKLVRVANTVLDLEQYELGNNGINKIDRDFLAQRAVYNESMNGLSPEVILAIKDSLDRELLSGHPDLYTTELRSAIADYTGLPAEYIGCFPGDYMSLEYISRTYLEPGTEMLINGPAPSSIKIPATAVGASVVEILHCDPFSPDLEEIINHIGKRTRMLYLGNPSVCVGSFFTEAELVFLTAYAENTMIVVDESYFEFSGFTIADLAEKFPNLTVIRSFSHAFGLTGMKVGYVITDPENLESINRLTGRNFVDTFALVAAKAALVNKDHLAEYVSSINKSKEMISSSLPGFGYEFYLSPADFFVLRVSDTTSNCELLKENNFSVTDLSSIRDLQGFVRIRIGPPDETERLLVLLGRIAEQIATGYNRNRNDNSLTEPKREAGIEAR
jgi:histidinol-phosphate aminotransferase